MAYRYCPSCEEWLEPVEYTTDEVGEQICAAHEIALHGYIDRLVESRFDFLHQHHPALYPDRHEMKDAALSQGIIR